MANTEKKKLKKFVKPATEIAKQVALREGSRRVPAYDTPGTNARGYQMKALYELARKKIAADKIGEIKAIARHFGQNASGTREENPFEWVLCAYHAALGPVDKPLRSKIKRMGHELLYAHNNNVDPEMVVGAIYQAGGAVKIRRLLKTTQPALFKRLPGRRKKRAGTGRRHPMWSRSKPKPLSPHSA